MNPHYLNLILHRHCHSIRTLCLSEGYQKTIWPVSSPGQIRVGIDWTIPTACFGRQKKDGASDAHDQRLKTETLDEWPVGTAIFGLHKHLITSKLYVLRR